MKKLFPAAFLFILAFTLGAFAQDGGSSRDRAVALAKEKEQEVRAAFDRLIQGIRQADVEKVMSVYHNDDRTLFFNFNGTATIGWQQMYENRKSSYAKRANTSIEPTGVRVEILSPTSAYVSCKWKQTQEFEGKLEQSSGRMTLVFKDFGEGWKIVHLHTSPDTFPSAVMVPASENDQ